MKKIYPRGFSSVLYFFFSILCILFAISSFLLLIIMEEKSVIEIVMHIFVIFDLIMLCCAYLLWASINIIVEIESGRIKVKGQPIIYKNRIQHSFELDIEKIIRVRIGYDEYNSKGEIFSSLDPRHVYQRFIYFETDDKVYKIWIKHFSSSQVDELLKEFDAHSKI